MKNYLLTFILLFSFFQANTQHLTYQEEGLDSPHSKYKISPGDTYTQTYLRDQLSNTLQIRARQRLSFAQIAKASLPFLAGTAYGIFGGKLKSSGQELSPASRIAAPSILGGATISAASLALRSAKKASVNLTYRNAIGQIVHTENRLINTGRKTNISLWRHRFTSVDVSVTAPPNQGISVQQASGRVAAPDSSTNNAYDDCKTGDCPPSTPEENYNGYMGSISNPYQYYGFYNQYADSGLNNVGGDTFYYSGSGANGTGYYNDPSFTEPGGAGYYSMSNPGPVNGPGLYPVSRQAEVYQYLWQHQSDRNVEQAAIMTDKGIFVLPDHGSAWGSNTINRAYFDAFKGINVQQGYNGKKMFVYKGVEYRIEGLVHTHPPASRFNGADGLSNDDINLANQFNVPIFAITDEGIWRGRPNGVVPGENIFSDYTKVFDPSYSISNLYGYE